MVSADSAVNSGSTNKIASVAIQRGNNLDGCNSTHQQARVSMLAVNDTVAPTLTNARFQIWFEGVPDSTPPSPINPPVD
jgi:hypothetical protein